MLQYASARRRALTAFAFGLVALVAGSAVPHAQSFDCKKASTVVEHLVCSDPRLGELDVTLATALKQAITAAPARRQELIGDERAWIAERDARCTATHGGRTAADSQCVADRYRAQIAHLEALSAKPVDTVSRGSGSEAMGAATCNTLAAKYRALGAVSFGKAPLAALTESPRSGVATVEPSNLPDDLAAWASKQKPPFEIGEDVQREWDRKSNFPAVWQLGQLPGTGFYSISSIEGTAHCYDSLYFEVKDGRAHLASAPAGFEDEEGAGCGVGRSFGRIDDRPAFFQEVYDYTPNMSSTLMVTTWEGGRFAPACTINFSFVPAFGGETLNPHEESCKGPACEQLRRAAFQLAAAVQKSPKNAEAEQLAALSTAQKLQYEAAVRLAKPEETSQMSDPGSLTEEGPLRVPYVAAGRVYVASLGHFTLGWRDFADWSVTFDALEGGKLVRQAAFAVGMRKGALESLTVEAVGAGEESHR